jgi:outer membrane autotransporter protein
MPCTRLRLSALAIGLISLTLSTHAQTLVAGPCDTPNSPTSDEPPLVETSLHDQRVRAMAVAPSADPGPTSIECLSLVHGAPMVRQSMDSFRSQLARSTLRLHRLHTLSGSTARPRSGPLATYASATQDARDDDSGAHDAAVRLNTTGLSVGADYRLNEHWVLGGTLALTQPRARWLGTGSQIEGHSSQWSAYASWSPTPQTYVSVTGSLESSRYALSTDMGTGLTVHTRARGHASGLSLAAGIDLPWGPGSLSPYARLDQVQSSIAHLEDTPGSTQGQSSAFSAGLQAQTSLPQSWGVLAPYARIELTQLTHWRVSGDSARAYASATGMLPVPHPIEVDRSYGQFGLGLSGILQRGFSVFADYDQGFGLKGVSQWRFNLGLRTEL